jgi:serine/threonine protein kinase/Tfp pilus assembly protein PilF
MGAFSVLLRRAGVFNMARYSPPGSDGSAERGPIAEGSQAHSSTEHSAATQSFASNHPSSDPLVIADSLNGIPKNIRDYTIRRVIANGGMGTVYEATQKSPRRSVALKVMRQGVNSSAARRRFEHESQMLGSLRHPGIAQVFEAGIFGEADEASPFFAMEYIPNALTICDYANQKNLSLSERLELFLKVCAAVQHGHQKGIIHRDLKPGNILVDSMGQAKIIDFGVARSTDADLAVTTQQTAVGDLIGTLKYMSPEQCQADPHDIDTRSDVYSLGVVLYELLTRKMPYDVKNAPLFEVIRIIREEPIIALRSRDNGLRGDLETIINKALEKDRDRRYQAAQTLADDISHFLNHEPISARPPSLLYNLRKFIRKYRWPILAAGVLLVTSGVALNLHMRSGRADARLRAFQVYYEAEALAKAGMHNFEQVILDCGRAISIDPGVAAPYALRAKMLMERGRYGQAWPDAHRALDLEPGNTLALRVMAFLLLEKGEFHASLDHYNRGIELLSIEEDIPRDFHNRARVHRVLGSYEDALVDHERAMALNQSKGHIHEGRGLTNRRLGNIDKAVEDLSNAVTLDPSWSLQCNLWIWEMLMLRGGPGDRGRAETALAAAQQAARVEDEKIYVDICRGLVTADTVLALSASPAHHCFANYYLGAKALVDGDRDTAIERFQECRNTRQFIYDEYAMATWHLQELAKTEAAIGPSGE